MSFSRSAWLRAEDEDSEDEEIQDEQVKDRPDAIVYLIEVSSSMMKTHLKSSDDDDAELVQSNVSTALRSAMELMKTRIISGSPRDVVGVVLYNTQQTRNVDGERAKEGIYMLLEPSTIRAANIKQLAELVEEAETSPKSFLHKFTPIDTDVKPTVLIEAMRFSENLVKTRSSNLANRSLYLITDNDDPFQGSKQQQSVALVFSNDAHESGLAIKTFFMPEDGSAFDLTKFWNRFRYDPSVDAEMDNASMVFSGDQRFDKLLSLSSEAGKTKRAMFSIPFFLYEDITMSVTGYAAINEQKKKLPVNIEQAEQIREVYAKPQYTDQNTGEDLDVKRDIVSYASIGQKGPGEQRIVFEKEEVLKIKNLGMKPSLKLLGFMPRSFLQPRFFYKHSYLIYPNETEYANSIPAFSALLKSMLKKDVVGLGVLVARSNSSPQIVCLLPQAEVRDEETDVQVDPPCIWMIQIAFADDIRDPTETASLSVVEKEGEQEPMVQAMKKLIKKMRVQYRPYQFQNPVLQYHYANLQAIALQEDGPEPKDETLPATEQIAQRIAPFVKEIKKALDVHPGLSSYTHAPAATKSSKSSQGPATKKAKTSKDHSPEDIAELEDTLRRAVERDDYKHVTVDILKDYLKQKQVKVSGKKKAELIDLVKGQLNGSDF